MSPGNSESISQDTVFDILSNARRRYVLSYLRKSDEPVELGDLAKELAAWENDTEPADLTKQQRKRVYVSLYQTHIQKLADADMVEYDQDTGLVSLAEGARELEGYLGVDTDTGDEIRWQRLYVSLAVVGGILYALVAFDVPLAGFLSELQVCLVILLSFSALAVAHYVYSERDSPDLPAESLIRNNE